MWSLCVLAALADETLLLSGELVEDGLDHAFLEFEVPDGTVELQLRHDDLSEDNILDWGLDDPQGFRGWGGGNAEDAIVGVDAASRSYLPGPLPAGTWRVVVGRAKIAELPARYEVELSLRSSPTLSPDPDRGEYSPALLDATPRWYAGDPHVHSRESGDASPTIEEVALAAEAAGLDFVALSEHNTTSHVGLISAAQARHPALLIAPSIEFTTYDGHAGMLGATTWVDHRIGQPGATVEAAAEAARAQGAAFVLNHPTLELGELCIGCAWHHELDPSLVDGMEIITGGWSPAGQLFFDENLALWEQLSEEGHRLAPVGGSDDHAASAGSGPTYSPIGRPTTLIYADELSPAGLVAGLRRGKTVVKLQGPEDPMLELWPAGGSPEAEVSEAEQLVATVRGGQGGTLQWVVDGQVQREVEVSADEWSDRQQLSAPARVRLQLLVEDQPRVLTSQLWLVEAAEDSDPGGTGGDNRGGEGPKDGGCGCGAASLPGPGQPGLVGLLGLLGILARRRR